MKPPKNPVVCTCVKVTEDEIVRVIRGGARTLAEVGKACEAGTGCTTCHVTILALLEDEVHRKLARDEAPEQLQQLGLFGEGKRPPASPGGAARKPKK